MTDPEVAAADAILRRHGIRYVMVGGQAIARQAATATQDVDVMVATADFASSVERLRKEADLVFDWEVRPVARFRLKAAGGVPLDLIDPVAFSGSRPGSEFFAYLAKEGSAEVGGIRYATPEVVWYTRLLTKRWRAYAEKIVTNVIDGLSPTRLRQVEEIARRFGNDALLRARIEYVRSELARPDIESLTGRKL